MGPWSPPEFTFLFYLLISRNGVCEELSGFFEKTDTNGKFRFHKSSKLGQRRCLQFSPLLKKKKKYLSVISSFLCLSFLSPCNLSSSFSEMSSSLPPKFLLLLLPLRLLLSLSLMYVHTQN